MREPAKLDFRGIESFEPKKRKPAAKPGDTSKEKQIVAEAAAQEGFTPRTGTAPKIDGRTLRRTGRTAQFNISVKPETKDRFWEAAQRHGFSNGEEFLLFLLHKVN